MEDTNDEGDDDPDGMDSTSSIIVGGEERPTRDVKKGSCWSSIVSVSLSTLCLLVLQFANGRGS